MADFILSPAGNGAHTVAAQTSEGLLFIESDWHNEGRVEADELPYFQQCCLNWGLTYQTQGL